MRLEPLLVLLTAIIKFLVDTKNAVVLYTNTAYESTLAPYVTTAVDVIDVVSHDLLFAVCPIRCFSQQTALAVTPRELEEDSEQGLEEILAMGLVLIKPVEKVKEPIFISLLVIVGNAAGPVEYLTNKRLVRFVLIIIILMAIFLHSIQTRTAEMKFSSNSADGQDAPVLPLPPTFDDPAPTQVAPNELPYEPRTFSPVEPTTSINDQSDDLVATALTPIDNPSLDTLPELNTTQPPLPSSSGSSAPSPVASAALESDSLKFSTSDGLASPHPTSSSFLPMPTPPPLPSASSSPPSNSIEKSSIDLSDSTTSTLLKPREDITNSSTVEAATDTAAVTEETTATTLITEEIIEEINVVSSVDGEEEVESRESMIVEESLASAALETESMEIEEESRVEKEIINQPIITESTSTIASPFTPAPEPALSTSTADIVEEMEEEIIPVVSVEDATNSMVDFESSPVEAELAMEEEIIIEVDEEIIIEIETMEIEEELKVEEEAINQPLISTTAPPFTFILTPVPSTSAVHIVENEETIIAVVSVEAATNSFVEMESSPVEIELAADEEITIEIASEQDLAVLKMEEAIANGPIMAIATINEVITPMFEFENTSFEEVAEESKEGIISTVVVFGTEDFARAFLFTVDKVIPVESLSEKSENAETAEKVQEEEGVFEPAHAFEEKDILKEDICIDASAKVSDYTVNCCMKRTATTLDTIEPTAQRIRTQSLNEVRIEEKTYERYFFRHNSTFVDPWIGFTVTFTSITITEYNNSTGSNNATIREIGEESEPVEAENMDAGNDKMDISSIWQKRRMSPEDDDMIIETEQSDSSHKRRKVEKMKVVPSTPTPSPVPTALLSLSQEDRILQKKQVKAVHRKEFSSKELSNMMQRIHYQNRLGFQTRFTGQNGNGAELKPWSIIRDDLNQLKNPPNQYLKSMFS